MSRITVVEVSDVRFPTSLSMDGSDAMNRDGDYSATYVAIRTEDPDVNGYGYTFTIGRGNDVCALATQRRAEPLAGREVAAVVGDLGGTYRDLTSDSQMRWLGPDKGVEHLALAAVMNAVWDLAARVAQKPLWKLLVDMSSEELVDAIDLTYLSDVLTETRPSPCSRRPCRTGLLASPSSRSPATPATPRRPAGSATPMRSSAACAPKPWPAATATSSSRSAPTLTTTSAAAPSPVRSSAGNAHLMIDANQVWDVPQAIEWVNALAAFKPLWIEEPTSPDDVLGHAAVRRAVAPIGVATGEHGMNRVLFKQMFQAGALDFRQLDAARLASINEIVPVYLMAKKFDIPVCPHAGGVGLCELVQHLSVFDYAAVSGSLDNRVTEFVNHLHEHFTDPCVVENGAYRLPALPGYSAEMYPASVADYTYPDGAYWAAARHVTNPAHPPTTVST